MFGFYCVILFMETSLKIIEQSIKLHILSCLGESPRVVVEVEHGDVINLISPLSIHC